MQTSETSIHSKSTHPTLQILAHSLLSSGRVPIVSVGSHFHFHSRHHDHGGWSHWMFHNCGLLHCFGRRMNFSPSLFLVPWCQRCTYYCVFLYVDVKALSVVDRRRCCRRRRRLIQWQRYVRMCNDLLPELRMKLVMTNLQLNSYGMMLEWLSSAPATSSARRLRTQVL